MKNNYGTLQLGSSRNANNLMLAKVRDCSLCPLPLKARTSTFCSIRFNGRPPLCLQNWRGGRHSIQSWFSIRRLHCCFAIPLSVYTGSDRLCASDLRNDVAIRQHTRHYCSVRHGSFKFILSHFTFSFHSSLSCRGDAILRIGSGCIFLVMYQVPSFHCREWSSNCSFYSHLN